MSRLSLKGLQAAAGAAAGGVVYVDDVFSTYLYEGTNTVQTITNGIDLAGEGGLVWTKNRDNNAGEVDHQLMDSTSGYQYILESNKTSAIFDFGAGILTPTSTGFDLSTASRVNANEKPYVSWTFRKQPGFFDVVTYTGNGTAGHTINHSLGSTPGMIIIKRYDSALNWYVAHRYDLSKYLVLNQTAAASSFAVVTATSDTTFTLPSDGSTNASGGSYVAYLFAHDAQDFGTDSDESIIKCGSYTGNGTAGLAVTLGWEPQWLMIKRSDSTGDWEMVDSMRGISTGGTDPFLRASTSGQEFNVYDYVSLTATGFQLSNDANVNTSGGNYVYIAIRRPHKPAEEFAATDLFALDQGGDGLVPAFNSGFPVDWAWENQNVTTTSNFSFFTRILGDTNRLVPANTGAEVGGNTGRDMDYMDGWVSGSRTSNGYSWMFRRAPGFFDVVAYTGDGTNGRTVTHNLGVTPEIMIVKSRSAADNWFVYHSTTGATKATYLNTSSATATSAGFWNDTAPTSSVFSTYSAFTNASSATYIAYLFATVAGISKVGSYTGTGSDVNVDCGFSSGARFVLVKRTDSTGDWYLWDSERGIVAGNDPYRLLNLTDAQVTSTDYIDPLSSGFTITSSAPAALNNSGGTYIFLAIA